jgi:hypothetical protein
MRAREIVVIIHDARSHETDHILGMIWDRGVSILPTLFSHSSRGREFVKKIESNSPPKGYMVWPYMAVVDDDGEILAISQTNPTEDDLTAMIGVQESPDRCHRTAEVVSPPTLPVKMQAGFAAPTLPVPVSS